jgi:hypothetical protein
MFSEGVLRVIQAAVKSKGRRKCLTFSGAGLYCIALHSAVSMAAYFRISLKDRAYWALLGIHCSTA